MTLLTTRFTNTSITIKNKQLTTFLSDDDDDDDDYHDGSICSFCVHCEVGSISFISLMKWTMSCSLLLPSFSLSYLNQSCFEFGVDLVISH